MNTINVLNFEINNQIFDFLDCSVRVQRSFTDSSEESFTTVELTDSVHYSNEQRMKQKQWNFVVRLENNNDFNFKRFINQRDENGKQQATIKISINVNGNDYVVYGVLANQESVVDFGVTKEYRFTVNISSRALRYTLVEQRQSVNTGDVYNVATYNVSKYSSIVPDGVFQFSFDNDADTNCYFSIQGNGINNGVYFLINDQKIEFNISNLLTTDTFEYSNIPLQLKLNVNNAKRLDLLNLNQNNFTIKTKTGLNNVYIYGLQNATVFIVKGYKII